MTRLFCILLISISSLGIARADITIIPGVVVSPIVDHSLTGTNLGGLPSGTDKWGIVMRRNWSKCYDVFRDIWPDDASVYAKEGGPLDTVLSVPNWEGVWCNRYGAHCNLSRGYLHATGGDWYVELQEIASALEFFP
jgi:hypothetical protein